MLYGTFAVLVFGGLFCALDPLAGPKYRGPLSSHFDGQRFHNLAVVEGRKRRFGDFLRWRFNAERGFWPSYINTPFGLRPPPVVDGNNLRVTFINHSTVLIQTAGLNLLTDPIWSNRAGPFPGVGPRRHHAPGLRLEDLPRTHVVLLSHNHYDHLCLATLRRLAEMHAPQFITPLGVGALLAAKKLKSVTELDWWSDASLGHGMRVSSVPAQHFSMRGVRDHNNTLWCGYVVQGPAGAVYFAGDTGYGPHFEQIARKFEPLRLALLPIGAYKPAWFMAPVHLSPEEALRAHQTLRAETSVAIHFGTFALGDDGEQEPVTELHRILKAAGEPAPRFWILDFGEGRDVPPARSSAP